MLLAVCLVLFIESRVEAFVPQLKIFARERLEEALGGKFRLSVGNIDGGIIHPLVFSDIRIRGGKDRSAFLPLAVNCVRTNYRIWDVLFKFFRPKADIYINFTTHNKELEGFAEIRGGLKDSDVKGYLYLFGKGRIDFAGRMKNNSFDAEIKLPSGGTVKAEGILSEDGALSLDLKASHLKVGSLDIVCDSNLKNKSGCLEGVLKVKNLIVNYKPFLDLEASYKISGGILEMSGLNLGDCVRAYGRAVLREPFNIDAAILANNLNLGWFLSGLGVENASAILSGTVNGKIALKGPINNLKSTTRLEIRKGTMSTLEFETLSATLKGDGPFIRIEDSRITRDSGYFSLAGEMDLRKIGKASLFEEIRLVTDEKAITWDGWDSSRTQDFQEIRMKKKINDIMSLDFKKVIAEEKIDESLRDRDEVRLEYKLEANEALRMMIGQNKDFFGVEHKDKF